MQRWKWAGHLNQSQLNLTCFILWYVHKNMKWQFVALNSIPYLQLLSPSLKLTHDWLDAFSLLSNNWEMLKTSSYIQHSHFNYLVMCPLKLPWEVQLNWWRTASRAFGFKEKRGFSQCKLTKMHAGWLVWLIPLKLSLNISARSSSADLLHCLVTCRADWQTAEQHLLLPVFHSLSENSWPCVLQDTKVLKTTCFTWRGTELAGQ